METFEAAKQFFVKGLHLLEANNLPAAETQFALSLELVPDRVSTLNNLSAVRIRLKKFAEAEEVARKAIAMDDTSPEAWSNLGAALLETGRHDEALRAYERTLEHNGISLSAWRGKTEALFSLKRYEEALLGCDQALRLDPDECKLLHARSLILKELGRKEEARKVYLSSLARRITKSPVFSAERLPSQNGDALIISPDPILNDSLKSFDDLHRECINFPGQLSRVLHEDFHFSFVFSGDAGDPSVRSKIPQPDFVINNCVNLEVALLEGDLPGLIKLVDSFGVTVVNHPTKVAQAGRDGTVNLLKNIPGVVMPKTKRFSSEGKTRDQLVREIEAEFDYPLITRSLYNQKGIGMDKVDSREALLKAVASGMPEKFFVTQFVETRRGNELYRKIRAAIVQDEIVVVRVDYHTSWKVHGGRQGRRVSFYLENPHLLEDEKRICANLEKELGQSVIESLRAIRDRIPLDIFGIDFEVNADGLVVFFEANASMNLLTTAQKEVPNPKEANDYLKQLFRRYLASLVGQRGR